jgi:hypothetical protein
MEESRTAMNLVSEVARFLSAASLGIFAGAMLTEGLVLVPYWRSLTPAEFFGWYGANDQRLQASRPHNAGTGYEYGLMAAHILGNEVDQWHSRQS